ncbi:MAG: WbuC family cupin fold metalloprotein [Bacteriovoracaceae bacterium]|nr:WbuC family cupin fold metalloprotein [Bacteriovoracaceae bacterium]
MNLLQKKGTLSPTLVFQDKIAVVNDKNISVLRELAQNHKMKRSRICLHGDDRDKVHEMLIFMCKDSVIPPHRQPVSKKTYLIIKGSMKVVFYDENGNETRTEVLSPSDNFILSFNPQFFHHPVLMDEDVFFLETLEGPYPENKAKFAPWINDN